MAMPNVAVSFCVMRTLLLFSTAALLSVGPSMAMDPPQLPNDAVAENGILQQQTSLNSSSQQLRGQAMQASTLPLLEQGPRHPGTPSLLNLGF